MLKRTFVICLAILVITSMIGTSFAANKERVTTKIDRGGKKLLTAPLEIPKAIVQVSKESNIIFGLLFGPFKGVCNFVSKVTSGGADVVGCNVGETKEELIKPEMIGDNPAKK